jgi:hypothetical protein
MPALLHLLRATAYNFDLAVPSQVRLSFGDAVGPMLTYIEAAGDSA